MVLSEWSVWSNFSANQKFVLCWMKVALQYPEFISQSEMTVSQWQIQGRGPGDLPPPLILAQTEAKRAKKNFFRSLTPPSPPPIPYLKVWIWHCYWQTNKTFYRKAPFAAVLTCLTFPFFWFMAGVDVAERLRTRWLEYYTLLYNVQCIWKNKQLSCSF